MQVQARTAGAPTIVLYGALPVISLGVRGKVLFPATACTFLPGRGGFRCRQEYVTELRLAGGAEWRPGRAGPLALALVGAGSTWRIVKASWRYLAIFSASWRFGAPGGPFRATQYRGCAWPARRRIAIVAGLRGPMTSSRLTRGAAGLGGSNCQDLRGESLADPAVIGRLHRRCLPHTMVTDMPAGEAAAVFKDGCDGRARADGFGDPGRRGAGASASR